MTSTVRVAACQYAPKIGDLDGNRELARSWALRAAGEGAQLIVLPELASSGYVFESEGEARSSAESLSGAFVTMLTEVCVQHGVFVVAGLAEQGADCRYNSAVMVGPQGQIATYRKLHLYFDEKSWFAPGEGMPVVKLPFATAAMAVCFDLWFPESVRTVAMGGADIVAVPTNWTGSFKRRLYSEAGYCQGDYVAMAAAAQNGVVMVCADRIGTERDVHFLGASIIVGADGWPVAGPAPRDQDALLIAEIDLEEQRKARQRTPRNHLFEDRRPDSYNALVIDATGAATVNPVPH